MLQLYVVIDGSQLLRRRANECVNDPAAPFRGNGKAALVKGGVDVGGKEDGVCSIVGRGCGWQAGPYCVLRHLVGQEPGVLAAGDKMSGFGAQGRGREAAGHVARENGRVKRGGAREAVLVGYAKRRGQPRRWQPGVWEPKMLKGWYYGVGRARRGRARDVEVVFVSEQQRIRVDAGRVRLGLLVLGEVAIEARVGENGACHARSLVMHAKALVGLQRGLLCVMMRERIERRQYEHGVGIVCVSGMAKPDVASMELRADAFVWVFRRW